MASVLGDIARKIGSEAVAVTSAPLMVMGDMTKGIAMSYLGRLNPINNIRLPNMGIIRVINEMRKDVVSKIKGPKENNPDIHKETKQIAEDVDDSVDLLRDIRDRLDDLLELFGRKEKREIRREKIEKHKNIDYDTKADFGEENGILKPHKNFNGWLSKLTNIRGLWKHALKALLPVSFGIYFGIKALDKGFTQIGIILRNILKPVKSIIVSLGKISYGFGKLGVFLKNVMKPLEKAMAAIRKIPVASILEKITGLSRLIRGFGRYVFGPITMTIFGIYEFVKGFLKSYQKDGKILKALGSGIDEIIKGFTVKPLDLLKDIISWVGKKLGFDNVSKWLDSWSFEDLYERLKGIASSGIKTVYEVFKNHFKRIGGYVSKYVGEYLPSYDDMVNDLQENWNTFTSAVNDIGGFIKDLITNPSKVWRDIKKKFPNFSKMIENLMKEIPSYEDIEKMFEGFSFDKLFENVNKSIKSINKWIEDTIKNIPVLGNFLNSSDETEKNTPIPQRFTAKPEKELWEEQKNALKEYVKKTSKSAESSPNVTINVNDNKNLVSTNQNTTDATPNVLITTPYTSRWETE